MSRGNASEFGGGCIRSDTSEKYADFDLPAAQVGPQDFGFLLISHFDDTNRLAASPQSKLALTTGADVADPLRDASRRDQISLLTVGQQIHRGRSPFPGGTP